MQVDMLAQKLRPGVKDGQITELAFQPPLRIESCERRRENGIKWAE